VTSFCLLSGSFRCTFFLERAHSEGKPSFVLVLQPFLLPDTLSRSSPRPKRSGSGFYMGEASLPAPSQNSRLCLSLQELPEEAAPVFSRLPLLGLARKLGTLFFKCSYLGKPLTGPPINVSPPRTLKRACKPTPNPADKIRVDTLVDLPLSNFLRATSSTPFDVHAKVED